MALNTRFLDEFGVKYLTGSDNDTCAYDTLWPWCGRTLPRSGVNSYFLEIINFPLLFEKGDHVKILHFHKLGRVPVQSRQTSTTSQQKGAVLYRYTLFVDFQTSFPANSGRVAICRMKPKATQLMIISSISEVSIRKTFRHGRSVWRGGRWWQSNKQNDFWFQKIPCFKLHTRSKDKESERNILQKASTIQATYITAANPNCPQLPPKYNANVDGQ